MFTAVGVVVFFAMVWRHWGLKSLHFSSQEPPWRTTEYKAKWKLIEPFLEPNRSKPFSPQELNLLIRLSRDRLWVVRGDAVIALSFAPRQQHREVRKIILERLKDSHPYVREMALIAVARMKAKEAVPHILPLLNDPDKEVRETTKKTLQKLGYQVRE
jgi:hypothetical protein